MGGQPFPLLISSGLIFLDKGPIDLFLTVFDDRRVNENFCWLV